VEGERGLLGQRLHERAFHLGEEPVVDRVRHDEDAEEALAEIHRHRDHGPDHEVRVVVLDDPRVAGRIGDQLAAARLGHPAGDALADRKLLGPEHLLDELRPGRQLALDVVGKRPVGREKPLHRDAAHRVGRGALEDARAQGPGAQDGGVHDALVQLLAGQPLAERLRHQVHEVERPLPVLDGPFPLLLKRVRIPPEPVERQAQRRQRPGGDT
jgi:hypothetical protein